MADESAVPVAALPQVRLRRYSVEQRVAASEWRIVDEYDAEQSRDALDLYLNAVQPVLAFDGELYRVVEDADYGIVRRYLVRPSFDVSGYAPESEPAEAPSGDGGS